MALEQEVRGQGLGRRLVAYIEELARAQGCTRIRTESFEGEAIGFYQKLGYQVVGRLVDFPEGYTYCWLRKDLSGLEEPGIDAASSHT